MATRPRSKRRKTAAPADTAKYLTPAAIASELSIRLAQVHALVKRGELPAIDITLNGRSPRYRILRTDLEAFIERRRRVTPTGPTANAEDGGDER